MRILGIETSCDETSAAVVEVTQGRFLVLSNVVASQVKIHAQTGGVVPEVAARKHAEVIIPVIEEVLLHARDKGAKRAKGGKGFTSSGSSGSSATSGSSIDAVAVTAGPGLVTSLLVGVEVARTLAWLWKKPVVAVNHLAGHVYANWLHSPLSPPYLKGEIKRGLQFPILCLIVSGGHTELVLMRKHLDFKIIGETRDDAAGEAFDKVAKMLNLGYPGGPAIAQHASQYVIPDRDRGSRQLLDSRFRGNDKTMHFPRPMIDSPDFDFSFSGLKTAVLYWLRAKSKEQRAKPYALSPTLLAAVCYEFQEAVVDVLVAKTVRAAQQYKVKTVLLGGGVAANQCLRTQLTHAITRELPVTSYQLPPLAYTTDNAPMIAAAGYFMAKAKCFTPWQKLDVDPNWALGKPQKSLI